MQAKGKRVLVGVLHSHEVNLKEVETAINGYANVRFINHDETRSGIDLLVIPDGIGVNPLLRGFGQNNLPLSTVCPKALKFFEHTFKHYHSKLALPIIGIGDGMCYLWNEIGGQLSTIGSKGVCIKNSNHDVNAEVDDLGIVTRFRQENLVGISTIKNEVFTSTLKNIVHLVMLDAKNIYKEDDYMI